MSLVKAGLKRSRTLSVYFSVLDTFKTVLNFILACIAYAHRESGKKYIYPINTSAIPGELSCENMISSHVKNNVIFTCEKSTACCYGYTINRAFRSAKIFR